MDADLFSLPARHDLHRALEEVADATLVVDQHAHPIWIAQNGSYSMPKLVNVLTEAAPLPIPQSSHTPLPNTARATLSFCRSLRDMHALLLSQHQSNDNCDSPAPDHSLDTSTDIERALEAARCNLGPLNLARRCFSAAGIAAVLIDDGLSPPPNAHMLPLNEMRSHLQIPVAKRVLRLETEAQFALSHIIRRNEHQLWQRHTQPPTSEKRPRTTWRAQQFSRAFRARIDPLPQDVVAFKSIAAYRSGLQISLDWTDEDLESALSKLVWTDDFRVRIQDRVIIDYIVKAGLQVAKRHAIPVQFHCGFGDPDLDLIQANPLLLRNVLLRFPDVPLVLLHAAWPYARQAAYLAATYPNVYVDFGLAVPLLSVRGMYRALDEALEIAPVTRLLYSSDAHSVPDAFYLAARWGRRVVAAVFAAAVVSGDLEQAEAKAAIRKILAENAVRLYRLPEAE